MASNMHNTRLLRFLIVVTIVVLTIFIYASYSSTQTLAPPPMRSPQPNAASLVAFSMTNNYHNSNSYNNSNGFNHNNNNNNNNDAALSMAANSNSIKQMDKTADRGASTGLSYNANMPPAYGGSHGNDVVVIKKIPHHRIPTIDENAIDDDDGALPADQGGGGDGVNGVVGAGAGAGAGGGASGVGGGGTGLGTSGAFGEDIIVDDTALDHFNNNNNDLLQEDQYVQSVDNTLGNVNNTVTSAGGNTLSSSNGNQHQPSASADVGGAPEQQDDTQQSQIMILNNINSNNINKIPESDVLIPTSNLQKFIESADKILKNISIQQQHQQQHQQQPRQMPANPSSMAILDTPNKSNYNNDAGDDDNNVIDDNDEAMPPSGIMTIKGAGSPLNHNSNKISNKQQQASSESKSPQQTQPASSSSSSSSALGAPKPPSIAAKITPTTKKSAVAKAPPQQSSDPTQGIPTQQIYEPGHMDDEIDIDQICPNKGSKLKLLILITSAQTHAEARLAIRQTWGHFGTRRDVSTAFILGRTTNNTIKENLKQENIIYGDLIRGHFIDSYNNLTLKTLSALEWVDRHCPKTKYILKTDDDMFINVPKLLQFLDKHSTDKRVIYGRLAKKWKPIRNKKSKYYISTGQFSASVFPPFTTGPAYVLTSDIVHELYERSLHEVYLKLEDVFTTGIVAQQLGIKRVHANEFLNRRIAFNPCNIRKSISVHMIKANEQFDLWKKLLDQTTKCK